MNILNCCPKKPKMSLDYIIKWIEDFQNENLSPIVEPIVNDYIANYDWAHYDWYDVPAIQQIISELDARIEIPNQYIAGNIPVWTSVGGLEDSGRSIDESLPYESSDNLITSGAVWEAIQYISDLRDENLDSTVRIRNRHIGDDEIDSVYIYTPQNGMVELNIGSTNVSITHTNISNLNRALETPDSAPVNNSDKLITSGAVYSALQSVTLPLDIYPRLGVIDKDSNLTGNDYVGEIEDFIARNITHQYTTIIASVDMYDSNEDEHIPFICFVQLNFDSAITGNIIVQIGTIKYTHNFTKSGNNIIFDATIAWTKKSI